MDITPPKPASLDDIEDAPDLEEGFAYTEAAHEGARVGTFYHALIAMDVPPKHAYNLTSQWLETQAEV